ncbi:MAG: hypothetical protein PHZ07_02705 [Patescibacteria group bacterium]|nr:hypothetical protein [Patescibacteria group bacterium]MDD4304669.1 hypothetical protein [Patescibacteria group bacterium]
MYTSIRFYIENPEANKELQQVLNEIDYPVEQNSRFVQISDQKASNRFLILQPHTFISNEALSRLDQLSYRVTMLVRVVWPVQMISQLQPRNEFTTKIGGVDISGVDSMGGSYDLLLRARSFGDALDVFRAVVPGLYPDFKLTDQIIRNMSFWAKLRILFGF